MNLTALVWAELTAEGFFRSLGSGMRGQRSGLAGGEWTALAIVAAIVLALGVASYLFIRAKRRVEQHRQPVALFEKLCEAHELAPEEADLLLDLTRHFRMALPARIFLEPERFSAENLPTGLSARAATLGDLKKRLFAGMT